MFEIDRELDTLLDEIEEEIESHGEASAELMERFHLFCEAHGEKADRIGCFLRMIEARIQLCRSEAGRLQERARSGEQQGGADQIHGHVLPQEPRSQKIEGREFTIHPPNPEEQSGLSAVHR